jgi:hypothetical protein
MTGNVIPKEVKKAIVDGYIAETTWKVALLTNSFNAVATPSMYSEVTSYEVANGNGYTTGGVTLTGRTGGYVDTTNYKLDATDSTWSSASFVCRYAVVYNAASPYLIRAIYDFGADKTVSAGTLTIQWNAGGLVKIS